MTQDRITKSGMDKPSDMDFNSWLRLPDAVTSKSGFGYVT
jgi:hypothetical protein